MIIDGSGMRQHSLKVRSMPGHPLCDKCKQPRRVTARSGGELTLQCPACADTRTYVRPDRIPRSFNSLGGVVAMEHEKGGRHADVQQDASGAVAIRCPNCSAPLDFDGKSTVIRCKFCEIAVRIPSHTLRSLGQEHPKQLRWWLYFTDVSEERKKLAKKAEARADKQRKAQERAEERELAALEASSSAGYQPHPKKKQPSNSRALLSVMISMGMVSAGAGLFVTMSHTHHSRTSTTTAPTSRTRTAPTATQKTYPTLPLMWQGKVTKASGVKLRRGEKCEMIAQVQGARVHWVTVRCGKHSIYDSRAQASGIISMGSNVAEAPADNQPGAYTYALRYTNTGQFSGRPQASIDTFIGQGAVFSTVPPIMRVEMMFPEASVPRTGSPMFDTPSSAPHVKWKATVTGATPGAPVKTGARCSLDVAFADSEIHATACSASLVCGRRWLYGTKKNPGGGKCEVDGSGTPKTISDTTRESEDHTPIFDYDALNHTASVTSKDAGYTVTLKLSK